MQTPFCGGAPEGLNLNETLMSEYMNSAGYTSQIVGKWHLGFTSWEHTPTFRGFQSFYGFYGCAQDYYLHGSAGSLDFHFDKAPRCGEGCSEPLFDAVAKCTLASGDAVNICRGRAPSRCSNCMACDDSAHYSTILFGARATAVIEAHDPATPLFLYLPSQVPAPSDASVRMCFRRRCRPLWRALESLLTFARAWFHNLLAPISTCAWAGPS